MKTSLFSILIATAAIVIAIIISPPDVILDQHKLPIVASVIWFVVIQLHIAAIIIKKINLIINRGR